MNHRDLHLNVQIGSERRMSSSILYAIEPRFYFYVIHRVISGAFRNVARARVVLVVGVYNGGTLGTSSLNPKTGWISESLGSEL